MHFNKKMMLLPILFCIIAYMTGKNAYAETMYENPDNSYVVVIEDDADLFCTPEQMDDEIIEVLRFSLHMLHSFGFNDIHAYISTRPEKSVGDPALWDSATESLKKAVEKEGLSYDIDEGGGAFYGPKIDLKIKDAIGREWQLSTVQFDFNLPEIFKMTFSDELVFISSIEIRLALLFI